jgi:hypothetical protein
MGDIATAHAEVTRLVPPQSNSLDGFNEIRLTAFE